MTARTPREESILVEIATRRLLGIALVPRYVVLSNSITPRTAKGERFHLAVIETNRINWPKEIDPGKPDVVWIVKMWRDLYHDGTPSCSYSRARAQAECLAKKLNRGEIPPKGKV